MIEGKLVALRPIEMDDLDRYVVWVNDPEVTRFMGIRFPVSRAQETEFIERVTRHTSPPAISLAIQTRDDGQHIGSIGLHAFSDEDRHAALGIMIGDKTSWNRGYGTDAIVTLLRYAFDELNLNRVGLEVNADNARGIACYRKCGFVEEGRLREHRYKRGAYADTLVMGVLAREFRALHPSVADSPGP